MENKPTYIGNWPPSKVEQILSLDNSNFDITLKIRLTTRASTYSASLKRYFLHELFQVHQTSTTVSFDELPQIMPNYTGRIRYPEIYRTYPQDVPIKKLVADIKAGVPVDFVSDFGNNILHINVLNVIVRQITKIMQGSVKSILIST